MFTTSYISSAYSYLIYVAMTAMELVVALEICFCADFKPLDYSAIVVRRSVNTTLVYLRTINFIIIWMHCLYRRRDTDL
jgi:hypothetical protein